MLQYSSANRQALPLASRQLPTVGPNALMNALRKCRHDVVEISEMYRRAQLAI